jgi:lipoate-protein ligase A
MYFLDQSFSTPHENLAWDEALIETADEIASESTSDASDWGGLEVLRVWQMPQPCVIVGRSSRVLEEVHVDRCEADGIPVLRRMSGGATIVAGPGCWMYSVLLSLDARPECRSLDAAHRLVMERVHTGLAIALSNCNVHVPIAIQGICDLTVHDRKISGNSLRVKRHWLMYHGTLLIDMPLEWISRYLATPPKQPEYREGRAHNEFVANLSDVVAECESFPSKLKLGLAESWGCHADWANHPWRSKMPEAIAGWMSRRYLDPAWHRSR